MHENLAVLRAEIERLGLQGGPPDLAGWRTFLRQVEVLLEEREVRIETLEELAAYSTGELSRVRQHLARSVDDVHEIIIVLSDALRVFQDAARGKGGRLDEALKLARTKFSLQLGATWLDHPIPDNTADLEMATSSLRSLQSSLKGLARQIADLVEDAAAAAEGRKELELAGTMQKMLVPPEVVTIPGLKLHSWFQPVAHCGGDWWSAHALTENDGLVVLGDVTGHGAPSAILTGAVKGACDLARMGMRGALQPAQLMRMLNRVILESARGEYMMTCAAVRVVAGGGRFVVSNAGHRPPLLVRNGQVVVLQAVRDPPLGATESHGFGEQEYPCSAGDLIVLYTDGIPETDNREGVEIGERLLRTVAQEAGRRGAKAMRDQIRALVERHRGDRPQRDDICLVVGEFV
jgi:serine phosphatase RsbU (regulator of sigma subunit)